MFAFFSIPSLLFEKKDTGVLLEIEIQSSLKAVQSMDQKKVCLFFMSIWKRFSHTSMGSEVVCIKAFSEGRAVGRS